MKLWIDDERLPPTGWDWAKTSGEAIAKLQETTYDEISFDHDLGGDDTTRPVVMWLCEQLHGNDHNYFPAIVRVHTANPVGRIWLEDTLQRYGTAQLVKW